MHYRQSLISVQNTPVIVHITSTKSAAPPKLDPDKWHGKRVTFVGGSVTRQMHEQLLFEGISNWSYYAGGHFLFKRNDYQLHNYSRCDIGNPYNLSHELDLRELDHNVAEALRRSDIIVLNVATWWASNTIGYVTDVTGERFRVNSHVDDYLIVDENQAIRPSNTRSFLFTDMMERALHLILAKKLKGSTLVWRSESFTNCPSGDKSGVSEVLKRLGVPVLNITDATCKYVEMFPDQKLGPHLCFPSVALHHWLKSLESQFM